MQRPEVPSELELFRDGKSLGVAFRGLRGVGPLFPAVEVGSFEPWAVRADFSAEMPAEARAKRSGGSKAAGAAIDTPAESSSKDASAEESALAC